jgi:hypothetical protein
MKKITILFFAVLALVGAKAQETLVNDANAVVRTVGNFTGIDASTGIVVLLKQGPAAVSVSAATPEMRDNIITEVRDGILYINIKRTPGKRTEYKKIRAYVSAPSLNVLNASAGASIKIEGTFSTDNLKAKFSSGSVAEGSLKCNALSIDQNSGSVCKLTGAANTLSVQCSSGAICKSFGLTTENCVADVNSGAMIEISVSKDLQAKATSGGSIKYNGACKVSRLETNSGGIIKSKAV